MMRRWLLVILLLTLVVAEASARVGGGESYSGGSSSSGSGGSGGGGGGDDGTAELIFYLIRFLFWLTVNHPAIGIPVDIVVIGGAVIWFRRKQGGAVALHVSTSAAPASPVASLDELRKYDPNFSEITFSDFCYSLYGRAHDARGRGELDRYAPYLSVPARNALRSVSRGPLTEVRGVIVGSFRVVSFGGLHTANVSATVEYESNYTEVVGGAQQSWYVKERWVLERRRDVLSPPPQKAKADHCPRCGAALSTRTDGACDYCGVKIQDGAFQWYVRQVTALERQTRGPLLTSNVPEQGTNRPTVWQPKILDHRRALEAEHPGFDWNGFKARAAEVAVELQNAWSARDWERVRPLETESLFQMHRYWIDAYLRQNLRNVVDDFRIGEIEIVKVTHDAFYEAVTTRVWAEGRDYTVDAQNRVVAGSKTSLRKWTEYWTFIRSRASQGSATLSCPNCGARVAAGATGICDHCGGKLTAGQFDWVLSRIEQDESYRG